MGQQEQSDSQPERQPIPLPSWQHPPVEGAQLIQVLDAGEGRHHSRQTKARKQALDALFAADVMGYDGQLESFGDSLDDVRDFARVIVLGVADNLAQIDQRIADCVPDEWPLERLAALDRNLARIGVWELEYAQNAPAVVVAELQELADEYSTDSSARFIAGLLANVTRTRAPARNAGLSALLIQSGAEVPSDSVDDASDDAETNLLGETETDAGAEVSSTNTSVLDDDDDQNESVEQPAGNNPVEEP
jgi:N utilization substance protein B